MVEAFFAEHLTQLSLKPDYQSSILSRLKHSNSSIPLKKPSYTIKYRSSVPTLPEEPQKTSPKINLKDKKQREAYYEEERKKVELTQGKAKEWIREQKERKEKMKQKNLEELSRVLQDQENSAKVLEEKAKEFKENYYRKLEAMRLKKEQKTKEVEELKERGKEYQFISKKPLFKVIEEKYQSEVELPNLEKRKTELAKLRMMNVPVNQYKIKEHMQWYDDIRRQNSEKIQRNASQRRIEDKVGAITRNFNSSMGARIYREDKETMNSSQKAYQERLELIRRRNNYAKVVKDVIPLESSAKKDNKKLEKINEYSRSTGKRFSHHAGDKNFDKFDQNYYKKYDKSEVRSVQQIRNEKPPTNWKPKKYPKNPLVPEPPTKKEGYVVDYLAQKRKEREQEIITTKSKSIQWERFEGHEQIKAMSNKVEHEIKRHEIAMKNAGNNLNAIKTGQELDDMLVSSIKAKLSLLDNIQTIN